MERKLGGRRWKKICEMVIFPLENLLLKWISDLVYGYAMQKGFTSTVHIQPSLKCKTEIEQCV